jgi:nitrogen-specific signal transduction histidine kinase/CheY-like chemotaxis protein
LSTGRDQDASCADARAAGGQESDQPFVQMQKMEALGRLTGGIAHDFNNLLTGILGYASLLKASLPEGTEQFDAADYIERAAKRASHLTRQLLAYSRKETAALLRPTDVHRIVDEAVEILSRFENKDIRIVTRLDASRFVVEADPTGLIQLLLNLGVNAGDAMPADGLITISTGNFHTESDSEIEGTRIPEGDWLSIRFTDTGTGIPPGIRDMIFDPFFTTKGEGKGTGLGLSTAYNCVKAHRGFIFLENGNEVGASFLVLLPLSTGQAEQHPSSRKTFPLPKCTGTILVIDDEEIPRRLACDMLRALGYKTFDAPSGEMGLALLADGGQRIDLVLLDKIMPGMDGSETRRRIRDIDPALPVVLCSGYIDDAASNPDILKQFDGFLPKPFKLEELAGAVGSVLEARSNRPG